MAGVLMATCGDYIDAFFGALRPAALSQWRSDGVGSPPFTSDVDIGPWSWEPLPTRGESGICAIKKNQGNTGIRIQTPTLGSREHSAKRGKTYMNPNLRLSFLLLQLELWRSDGQLPGSSEPPRKSGNASTYAEIREPHTAAENSALSKNDVPGAISPTVRRISKTRTMGNT